MATVWKEPIFDRTLEDVEFAIKKLNEWKQNHTHSANVRVENKALVLEHGATAYVNEAEFVLQAEGTAHVHDSVLIVTIGDVYDLKGCFNLLDLNRIEGNIAYLAEQMESFYYPCSIRDRQWTNVDMPTQNDMSRIVENIRNLIGSFYSPDNPPSLPTTMISYSDINAIEGNLYLIKQLLDSMQSSFKKSGTIKNGSTMFLPIRR